MKRIAAVLSVGVLMLWSGSVQADFYHVSVPLSDLGVSSFQLVAELYDNSGVIGDSWARMDNVAVGSVVVDFEDGTLGGFDESLNDPDSVEVVGGTLDGTGSLLMWIDEDPIFSSTIVFRDYSVSIGDTLTFDVETTLSTEPGFWGLDQFVVSLKDPDTGAPLLDGLTGFGDILAVDVGGFENTGGAEVTVVPAPAAVLLGLLGFGAGGLGLRRGRTHLG